MRIDFTANKDDTPGAPVCLAMTAIKEKPADKATPAKKRENPPAEKS